MAISFVTLVRLFLLAVSLFLVVMAAVAWYRRGRSPDATIVTLLMVSAALYCFGYAGEVAQTTLPRARFWLHVEYLGIPWTPALWVLLARRHIGLRTHLGLLFAIPVITFVGEWSNSLHGLYNYSVQVLPRGPFWVVSTHRGPLAWLNLVYLYSAFLYGTWIYVSGFRAASRLVRIQNILLAASSLPPLCGYLIYLFGMSPWGLDLAPLTMGVTVILAYFAVFRLESFNLVPMAHSLVFTNMRDAALVTDLHHRLVDFNPAARELLPGLASASLGDDLSKALGAPPFLAVAFRGSGTPQEIELCVKNEIQYFQLCVFPLRAEKQQMGWAIILADVTAQHRLLRELHRDAETDELTGIANRRSFTAAIERELARCKRSRNAFSVILVDLDHFKSVNDCFGHGAGDRVLCMVAGQIAKCLRKADLLCRYGGDEFAILLPETGLKGAGEVAERIRAGVANSGVEFESRTISASISVGLAVYCAGRTADWQQLLAEADQALYRAKADGRNRVASWKERLH